MPMANVCPGNANILIVNAGKIKFKKLALPQNLWGCQACICSRSKIRSHAKARRKIKSGLTANTREWTQIVKKSKQISRKDTYLLPCGQADRHLSTDRFSSCLRAGVYPELVEGRENIWKLDNPQILPKTQKV
jgi:hypothetical protein